MCHSVNSKRRGQHWGLWVFEKMCQLQYVQQMCVSVWGDNPARMGLVKEKAIVLWGTDTHEINLLSSRAAAMSDTRCLTIPCATATL